MVATPLLLLKTLPVRIKFDNRFSQRQVTSIIREHVLLIRQREAPLEVVAHHGQQYHWVRVMARDL